MQILVYSNGLNVGLFPFSHVNLLIRLQTMTNTQKRKSWPEISVIPDGPKHPPLPPEAKSLRDREINVRKT